LIIRSMTKKDIPAAGELLFQAFNSVATQFGLKPKFSHKKEGIGWAWALYHHHPVNIFIADIDGQIAGLCCLNPRGAIGGVGPVAVDPQFQKNHVGREIMTALIDAASPLESIRLVQEAYNPASFSLYHALGFLPVACLVELVCDANTPFSPENSNSIKLATAEDLSELQAYDKPISKSDRSTDFKYYTQWGKLFFSKPDGKVRGLLAALSGPAGVNLGPLLADDERQAAELIQHAMSVLNGKSYRIRLMARDQQLVNQLRQWGFSVHTLINLMVKGDWRPGSHVEGFGAFPESI